jgi:hypothetical protein
MSTALQTIVADMWKASRAEVYSPKGFLGKGFRSEQFSAAEPKALTTKVTKERTEASVSFVMDLR